MSSFRYLKMLFFMTALLMAVGITGYAKTEVYHSDSEIIQLPATDDAADNDELFEGYVYRKFYSEDATPKLKTSSGSRRATLSEPDQRAYDILKEQIVKVADGDLDSAEFKVSLKDVYGDEAMKHFSKKDLGVASIVDGEYISNEAIEALNQKFAVNFAQIKNCLMADLPYELYWFDKTIPSQSAYPVYGADNKDGEWKLFFSDENCTFSMCVATDYSKGGAKGTFSVDKAKTKAATTSAANAKKIVEKYTAKKDIEKLDAYRKEICDLVEYDYYAATHTVDYMNPWQLIWVFDGNPSTKVVCEGYAKAFQYLCDMSTFEDKSLECHSVTGIMAGGTGQGNHMWNIVSMSGGRNYLVDLTNCDKGSVGADDKLFLVMPDKDLGENRYAFFVYATSILYQYGNDTLTLFGKDILTLSTEASLAGIEHDHYIVHFPANQATCTAAGNSEYWKCTLCGKYYKDAKGNNQIKKDSWVIPAKGHTWDGGEVTVPATTSSAGVRTYTCTGCGITRKEAIPKLVKQAQPMTVTVSKATVEAAKLKKKAQKVKPIKVKNAAGKVTYKITGGKKKSRKVLGINKNNGKITVKKKTGKGKYTVKVKVTAAGNANYNAGNKTVKVTVEVN